MFLNTLGIKEWVVREWISVINNNGNDKSEEEPQPNVVNFGNKDQIENFLDQLPKLKSHYCRSMSSKL